MCLCGKLLLEVSEESSLDPVALGNIMYIYYGSLICFVCFFHFLFFETGFLLCNSSGWPGAHFVDQAGLELTEISLLGLIKGVRHHCKQ